MTNYSTPGVYVQEISTLPPSVAQVSTAVPAFIGFTEKGEANQPVRISSMLEFQTIFGSYYPAEFSVSVVTDNVTGVKSIGTVNRTSANDFHLYYCMRHFFDNGGGSCYVVSLGAFGKRNGNTSETVFTAALDVIRQLDEPTLLVFPDALFLSDAKYYSVVNAALEQCMELQDRFTIIDVDGDANELKTGTKFRNASLTTEYLKYGAAYTPYLNTSYSYGFSDSGVTINEIAVNEKGSAILEINKANGVKIEVSFNGEKPADAALPQAQISESGSANANLPKIEITQNNKLTITVQKLDTADATKGNTIAQVKTAWLNMGLAARQNFELRFIGDETAKVSAVTLVSLEFPGKLKDVPLDNSAIKENNSALYNQIRARLGQELVTLPPSAAMAGVYARVDRDRGVWKAPANVSLASVIGPSVIISNEEQGRLNIDPTSGKSINCIRSFTGKGTLVWGARTLAGNDNEWRYINVRRLFITIEESVEKASAFAVFEPNDASTWLKVKAMIDNYLYGLWQQGALAGPTPESSYFVNIGLGKTMTTENILNGYMIVEVGIAAVRPAEFIVLRFSHKLQEA
ncbi:MAG: phage tail sheath C-terminal domain-containing protein [Pyrinomonadaceae bacterium]